MKVLSLFLGVVVLMIAASGCAQLPMKQCDAVANEADLFECKEQVQGHYWKCEKNPDLKHCSAPQ